LIEFTSSAQHSTAKKGVRVNRRPHYFAHTNKMGEFLMQFEEEEMKTFETIYHY